MVARVDVTSVDPATRPPSTTATWFTRRLFPVLATIALIIVGMVTTTWGARLLGEQSWALPHDLWRTLVAAGRLQHLQLGGLYTKPTALITFPGAALVLVPIGAAVDAVGLDLAFQTAQNPYPAAWFVIGPLEIALSATALFAADAMAERMLVGRRSRALLATAGAVVLWNVSVRFGHPEDAVAVALLLFGILALSNARPTRSAWLIGMAVAVQPLVLLGLPVVLATVPLRRIPGFLIRAAVPAVVLLAAAAAANWDATIRAVTSQPNWPTRNHPTPWTALAPEIGGGAVAAGPSRALAVLLACGCACLVARRWTDRESQVAWRPQALERLLWWVAVALTFRCVFETVMVAYYVWPTLAVALVAAARSAHRLVATAFLATFVTFMAQAPWHGPWLWWGITVIGLLGTLYAARPPAAGKPPDDAAAPGPRPVSGDRSRVEVGTPAGRADDRLAIPQADILRAGDEAGLEEN